MRTWLCTIFLLLSLTLNSAAQEWKLYKTPTPLWVQAGESQSLLFSGPEKGSATLSLVGPDGKAQRIPLTATNPGLYLAVLPPLSEGSYRLSLEGQTSEVGQLEAKAKVMTFTASETTVTRQGPDSDFERLTPLMPGTKAVVDQRAGDWYRSVHSHLWIDGRTGTLADGVSAIPFLTNAKLDSFPNGDGRLTLSVTSRPQIQALHQPAERRLTLTLAGTQDLIFELNKPTGHAAFLDSVSVRPEKDDTVFEINGQIGGYALEPGDKVGDVVVRLRRPTPKAWKDLIITLDAGHGGPKDPGTVGHGGLPEKVLNLRVTEALAIKLRAKGATVVMTRTSDADVASDEQGASNELQARVDLSVAKGAHLFLSLHHNARPSVEEGKITHGTDIYYYHPVSEQFAAALADPIADAISEPLRTSRFRSFHVIRQSFSPSVLIEFQYLSNPTLEKSVLDRPDYANKAAEGVVKGLEAYLRSLP